MEVSVGGGGGGGGEVGILTCEVHGPEVSSALSAEALPVRVAFTKPSPLPQPGWLWPL